MERLSGLDASFLYLESRSQLMHIVGVIEVDVSTMVGGYSFEKMRDEMDKRITAMPPFRRKLHDSLFNLDHPVWIEDHHFDIERHVHRVALPSPGSDRELADFCAHVAGQPLDRSKPLWEMWVIEGMAATDMVGIILRMHHAGVDGVTASDLLANLCTLTPDSPDLDDALVSTTTGGANLASLAADGVLNVFRRPLSVAKVLPQTARVPVQWALRARRDDAMPLPFRAPRTPFNGTITPHRSIGFTQVSMDDLKRIKDHFDVKLNDVVLSVVAGALRQYLLDRGELPDRPLTAVVPVSVHGDDSDDFLVTKGTNKVTGMFTRLPTDIADPIERMESVRGSMGTSKSHQAEMDSNLLRAWAQIIPSNTVSALMRFYADKHVAEMHPAPYNLVVSNVPGPDFPMYYLGAKIKSMYPLGPIMHGMGMNVTVFSVDGHLNFGVIACKEMVPDPWPIARAVEANVKALLEACDDV